ncbi:MAG: helix-turn-helix domain-containing protein [Erysipelotrichaceae bacterium]|nr:helix-turn-helix domain-containing protein [Erysipelotrichaceae bacterium]
MRQVVICGYLLNANEQNPVSSQFLAEMTDLSIRTIKSEISYLKTAFEESGHATIQSIQGKGYCFKKYDDGFDKEAREIAEAFAYSRVADLDTLNKRLYVTQTLLSETEITADDLALRIHYSASSISPLIKWSKLFFNAYGINMKSHLGLSLEGDEFSFRKCAIECFVDLYYILGKAEELRVSRFEKMFFDDIAQYYDIRHAFLDVIREYDVVLKDIDTKKMSAYICLLRNRIQKGFEIRLSESQRALYNTLKNTYEYTVAQKVFAHPVIRQWVRISDDELLLFTVGLFVLRDFDLTRMNTDSQIMEEELNKAQKMVDYLKGYATEHKMHDLLNFIENCSVDLKSEFISLCLTKRFHYERPIQFLNYAESSLKDVGCFSMEISRVIAVLLKKEFDVCFNKINLTSVAVSVEYYMKKLPFLYHKRKLLVTSTSGLVAGNRLREEILMHFGQYIDSLELYNQYEMRKLNLSSYHGFFIDTMYGINNYSIPMYIYRPFSRTFSQTDLFHKVFKEGYSRDVLYFLQTTMNVIEREFSSKQHVFDILSQKAKNPADQIEQWNEVDSVYSVFDGERRQAVLFYDYNQTNQAFFDVYIIKGSCQWEGTRAYVVYAISLPEDLNWRIVKVMDQILIRLFRNTLLAMKLLTNKDEVLELLFEESIEADFFHNRR